jgi:hypothetical protein
MAKELSMTDFVISVEKKSAKAEVVPKVFGMVMQPMQNNTSGVATERIKTLMKKHFQKMKLPKGVASVVDLVHQDRQERAVGR